MFTNNIHSSLVFFSIIDDDEIGTKEGEHDVVPEKLNSTWQMVYD